LYSIIKIICGCLPDLVITKKYTTASQLTELN